MTESIQNEQTRMLCELALDDASVLQYPLPDGIFGFHGQQSVEKLLKGLIAANGRTYPFTHDLNDLTDAVLACGEALPATPYDLLKLQPYAVDFRYTLGQPISDQERSEIRDSLASMARSVLARILALEAAEPPTPSSPSLPRP